MSAYDGDIFGQRVERRMEMYSKRQEDLARAAHCSRQVIGHYINGRNEPKASTLVALSDELHCSVDYLVGKTSAPNPQKELAMDRLGLSRTAVAVINGESPHQKALLRSLGGLPEEELEKNLSTLSHRQPSIQKTTASVLEHPAFERAMLTLQRACEFESQAYQAKLIKTMVDGLLMGDDSVTRLPDGMYAVSRSDAAASLKAQVMRHLESVVDALIEQNTAPAEEPKR